MQLGILRHIFKIGFSFCDPFCANMSKNVFHKIEMDIINAKFCDDFESLMQNVHPNN